MERDAQWSSEWCGILGSTQWWSSALALVLPLTTWGILGKFRALYIRKMIQLNE